MALSSAQHDFLNLLEQYWYENGQLPTQDYLRDIGLDSVNLWGNFNKPSFRDALLSRGISLHGLEFAPTDKRARLLTEEQLAAANTMLDLRDNRSQRKKLQELGIPTQKWEAWLRDPAFSHYLRTRAENSLGDNQHEAHMALVDRVRSGDVSAIKYFNELTGRYVPNRSNNVDVSLILMRVVEAVQKYVADPQIQELIAADLLGFAVASGAIEQSSISGAVGAPLILTHGKPLSSSPSPRVEGQVVI